MSSFQLIGLAPTLFAPHFELSDAALAERGMKRCIATESPGWPCRVSLEDAAAGEELLLLPFEHQPHPSPYRASGPIFVRRGAGQRLLAPGHVPPYVAQRTISVRAYDSGHMMVDALVCEGAAVGAELSRLFDDGLIAYVHLHNAKQGCYSCRAERIDD